ncbi:MAG: DNA translocase FtsK [Bacteroidota bacterium]
MADKSKKNNGTSNRSEKKKALNHKPQILSVLLIIAGVLIGLAIFFYSAEDEALTDHVSALDVFRLPFDDAVKSIAANIHNPLGLVGALISGFFVNATLGYASFVFPLLMVLWGWVLLRKKDIQKPLTFTNYAIIFGLLFSAAFGIANLAFNAVNKEWFGLMGVFLADVMIKLLGIVGASIVVLTSLFITIILAIDLDIHKSLERVAALWNDIHDWWAKQRSERAVAKEEEDKLAQDIMINRFDDESEPAVDQVAEQSDELSKLDKVKNGFQVSIDRQENDELPPLRASKLETTHPVTERHRVPKVELEDEEIESTPAPKTPKAIEENEDEELNDYVFPSVELLDSPFQADNVDEIELKANAELVKAKLANFGIEIESVSVFPGPVITMYELVPASGVKISRIVNLADDLALALAAKGIRIIAPIPGKSAVGVEIPNKNASIVHIRSVLNSNKFRESKATLSIAIGKTISGDIFVDDLAKMPHLLIAGSTGSGKSVGINTILASLVFRLHPSDVKFIIIDPKKIELTHYGKLVHHFLAVSPDIDENIITTPENAVAILKSVELEMEKRYDRLAAAGVRNIADYNERLKAGRLKDNENVKHKKMPFLVIVIDELADLMITAAREVEEPIARLAQLARAVGIHLILATQRPSVDVITGVIKANFPARLAYQVASKTDSRTILDMNGAEQLLGAGDMLYLPSGSPKPVRIQNAFISSEEVERLTDHIDRQPGYSKPFTLPSILERRPAGMKGTSNTRDDLFEEAARLVVRHQQGSVSLIQRRLKVGYSRAARIIDELESAGVVGPFDGSKARLVLIDAEDQLERILQTL